MSPKKSPDKIDLLSITRSRHRVHATMPYYDDRYSHHHPYFTIGTVDMMLRDSRIKYALGLIKGPIVAYTKFFSEKDADDPSINQAIIDREYNYAYKIESESEETAKFVIDTLNHFWNDGVLKALLAIEWGFSPAQIIYKREGDGLIHYDSLLNYTVKDCRPVSKDMKLTGIFIKGINKFIPLPKSFVHVHQREYNRFTGRSRLVDAHIPWHETWNLGGARDIRRVWYFKNSYDSGTLYVPSESLIDQDGNERTSTDIAVEIMENARTGSYRIFPRPPQSTGKTERSWDYEPPKANTTPDGMREYLTDLRTEILEGMGIPPEVVENGSSSGMGSATGRKVPLMAFLATLTPIVNDLITDCRHQIINPLLIANKKPLDYKITRIIPKTFIPGGPDDPMLEVEKAKQSETSVK